MPGCHVRFEALFGIGAFNDDATNGVGRFRGLLGGKDECMSAFLGCRDGQSVAQLGTGPLSVPIQDSGFGFETEGQMKITSQREELRKVKLSLLHSARQGMRRVAFISTMGSHAAKAFLRDQARCYAPHSPGKRRIHDIHHLPQAAAPETLAQPNPLHGDGVREDVRVPRTCCQ